MIPRAVQMAKAVTDSGLFSSEQGNILAPFCRGWANNSVNYVTYGTPENGAYDLPGFYAGAAFPAQPSVYGFVDGQPFWRWFPVKPCNILLTPGSLSYTFVPQVRGIVPSLASFIFLPPPLDTLLQPS